jgi:uncharacterized RDD family membrane protein YckC
MQHVETAPSRMRDTRARFVRTPETADERPPEPVGLEIRVETPENVVLTYQLAGPSVRCTAYFIDLLLRIGLMWVLSILLSLTGLSSFLPGMSTGLYLLAWFFNSWGYYVFSEGLFRGQSVGKHMMGLRVIRQGGYPITLWPAVVRNFIRAADSLPFLLNGVGFVSMLVTRNMQRLGDLAAGTVVITERRVVLPKEPIILEKIQPLAREELGRFQPDGTTLTAIEQFLSRRHVLSHERGHELASILAVPLAERLDYQGDEQQVRTYPMAFLARVYVTFLQQYEEDEAEMPIRPQATTAGVRP